MLQTLDQLLRHVFGAGVEVAETVALNRQVDYLVLRVRLRRPDQVLVVKLAGPAAAVSYDFERTALINRLVARVISLPEIIALDTSCLHFAYRYLITTFVPGEEWAVVRPRLDAREQRLAYRELGATLAALRTIGFPRYGELAAEDGETSLLAALAGRARRTIGAPRLRDIFLAVLDRQHSAFASVGPPTLCHDDLHGHNVLFHRTDAGWRLATMLDWAKAWAGSGESDLARMELWHGMTGAGFWEGYGTRPSEEYKVRRPVYQLLWCLEYAAPTPAHLADTQRICRRLGIPPISTFD